MRRASAFIALLASSAAIGETGIGIERAAELLSIKVVPVYRSRTPQECIRFMVEGEIGEDFDFAIRERHGEGCGGDPHTSPVIDRFRVRRDTGEVLWRDAGGEYRSFESFLRSRR